MSGAYYNEFDPFAAAWLRILIADGHIADGDVDERSIADVHPVDLIGYDQCHFFAGIGGWSRAIRLADWDDTRPVWTGSCPCQPFSAAGKRKGTADERHLWPEFQRLIAECNPAVVFGEQVASKDGRNWLAGVRADLEALGYAVGAADLSAAGIGVAYQENENWQWLQWAVSSCPDPALRDELAAFAEWAGREVVIGAPHIRQRLWWVADADGGLAGHGHLQPGGQHGQQPQDGGTGGLEHAASDGREQRRPEPSGRGAAGGCAQSGGMAHADSEGRRQAGCNPAGDLQADRGRSGDRTGDAGAHVGSHWSRAEWLQCSDGKARRVEPGIFPLAHGVSNRVGLLRGAGNAIVPEVAADFIRAYSEAVTP